MPSNFDYCAALVREADRDRYLATLFAPAERRNALYALYAFNIEIGRVRDVAREPIPGEIRLQWWREAVAGERAGEAAANPVAAALGDTLACYALSPTPLLALIDAHAFDLYDEPMASVADMTLCAIRTEGTVFSYACDILGADNTAIGSRVINAGSAYAMAVALGSIAHHAARRQLGVPLDLLQEHGVDRETIFSGQNTEALRAALADMRARARRFMAMEQAEPVPGEILPALLPVALVGPTLRRMERAGYDPFRFQPLPPWRRQWLLWRAARNPQRIFRA